MRRLPWLPAVVLVAWVVVRLLGLDRGWPLVPLIAFTPYVALAAVPLALVCGIFRAWWPAAVTLACGIALAAVVLPRARGEAASGRVSLRVLTANVYVGSTPASWLAETVRRERVDLLSVQELTPELDRALRDVLPYAVSEPRPGAEGTGLYGRMRLRARPPLRGTLVQSVADAAGVGTVVAVHPPPPTRADIGGWRDDLRALPEATILAGDFNATLDHHELRRILDRGYTDAADATGDGLTPTWPFRGAPLRVTIDHVLFRAPWRARSVEVLRQPRSDHRAVLVELVR